MKKIVSALLACVLLVSSLFVLTSCFSFGGGIPNGTYAYSGQEMVVKGNTISTKIMIDEENGMEAIMTYKLNSEKDEITLTYKDIKAIGTNETLIEYIEEAKEEAMDEEPTVSDFKLTDDGFKLGGITYTKK